MAEGGIVVGRGHECLQICAGPGLVVWGLGSGVPSVCTLIRVRVRRERRSEKGEEE
jgi:hypothetical protein